MEIECSDGIHHVRKDYLELLYEHAPLIQTFATEHPNQPMPLTQFSTAVVRSLVSLCQSYKPIIGSKPYYINEGDLARLFSIFNKEGRFFSSILSSIRINYLLDLIALTDFVNSDMMIDILAALASNIHFRYRTKTPAEVLHYLGIGNHIRTPIIEDGFCKAYEDNPCYFNLNPVALDTLFCYFLSPSVTKLLVDGLKLEGYEAYYDISYAVQLDNFILERFQPLDGEIFDQYRLTLLEALEKKDKILVSKLYDKKIIKQMFKDKDIYFVRMYAAYDPQEAFKLAWNNENILISENLIRIIIGETVNSGVGNLKDTLVNMVLEAYKAGEK